MTEDFDNLFGDCILSDIEKSTAPQTPSAFTDHDYVMQPAKSPAGSDSGVSVDSGGNSPRNSENDMSHFNNDITSMSGSPQSEFQYSPHQTVPNDELSPVSFGDQLSCSPGQTEVENIDLEHFDFSELDTIDTSALISDKYGGSIMDEDVSIDLGIHVLHVFISTSLLCMFKKKLKLQTLIIY